MKLNELKEKLVNKQFFYEDNYGRFRYDIKYFRGFTDYYELGTQDHWYSISKDDMSDFLAGEMVKYTLPTLGLVKMKLITCDEKDVLHCELEFLIDKWYVCKHKDTGKIESGIITNIKKDEAKLEDIITYSVSIFANEEDSVHHFSQEVLKDLLANKTSNFPNTIHKIFNRKDEYVEYIKSLDIQTSKEATLLERAQELIGKYFIQFNKNGIPTIKGYITKVESNTCLYDIILDNFEKLTYDPICLDTLINTKKIKYSGDITQSIFDSEDDYKISQTLTQDTPKEVDTEYIKTWEQRWWEIYASKLKQGLNERDAASFANNDVEYAQQEMYQFFNKKLNK